jgi:hypothetical protein
MLPRNGQSRNTGRECSKIRKVSRKGPSKKATKKRRKACKSKGAKKGKKPNLFPQRRSRESVRKLFGSAAVLVVPSTCARATPLFASASAGPIRKQVRSRSAKRSPKKRLTGYRTARSASRTAVKKMTRRPMVIPIDRSQRKQQYRHCFNPKEWRGGFLAPGHIDDSMFALHLSARKRTIDR